MKGLGYDANQTAALNSQGTSAATNVAQTLRWYMGVFF
jgi:hypothetical protein